MPASTENPTILIVDDSRLSRAAVETTLATMGLTSLLSAESAGQALNLLGLGTGPPSPARGVDLILLDIVMPDMDGIEACQLISGTESLRDIPIIMVTSRDDLDSLKKAFEAGAMDYIHKPIQEVELVARVRSALALKRETDRRKARERELLEITAKLAHANQELRRLSSLDGLTGIPNRRYFDETFLREWRRAMREGSSLALVMIDIDHFKGYNDHFGHLKGDDRLKQVARTLNGLVHRSGDFLARYGGEEFVALLPGTSLAGAMAVAEVLRRGIEDLNIEHLASPTAGHLTVSLGVATVEPRQGMDHGELLSAADGALYRAKKAGRNRVEKATADI